MKKRSLFLFAAIMMALCLYAQPMQVEVVHRVVVEDFTSTSCGFCPRGIVGKENLRNQFGDLYVGITLHQHSSSDAMYLALDRYASLAFAGAPQCFLDRKQLMDPYNGTGSGICAAFADYQAMPVQVGVEVEASWNQDLSQVNATATVQSLVDGADFNIEYVLIGDGITGTSSGFKQANFYNTYSNLNADLAIWCWRRVRTVSGHGPFVQRCCAEQFLCGWCKPSSKAYQPVKRRACHQSIHTEPTYQS